MSFLSKFRAGASEKGKGSKKEWTPPKLPPADEYSTKTTNYGKSSFIPEQGATAVDNDKRSLKDQVTTSKTEIENIDLSGVVIRRNDTEVVQEDKNAEGKLSHFSFLREDPVTINSEDNESLRDTTKESGFSFISGVPLKSKPVSKHVETNKMQPTQRKKKWKAKRPGYGNIDASPIERLQKERRSSSTSSASETKSIADDEIKENSFQTVSSQHEEPLPGSDEVIEKKNDTPFAFITKGDDSSRGDHVENSAISKIDEVVPADKQTITESVENERSCMERNDSVLHELTEAGDINEPRECNESSSLPSEFSCEVDELSDVINEGIESTKSDETKSEDIFDLVNVDDVDNAEGEKNEFKEDKICSEELMKDLHEMSMENSVALPCSEVSYELSLNQDEQTEIFLETLESREKALRDQLEEMKATQLEALHTMKKSFNSKNGFQEEIKRLQEEQNVAIARDDFAVAEKINQTIDQKQNELENVKFQHPLLDHKMMVLVDRCNDCLKNQIEECSYLQKEFKEIIKSEEKSLKKHIDHSDTKVYKAKLKLNEEKAKLDREMGHITLDKEHLKKNELQLDGEIHERTKSYQIEKNDLLDQRSAVMIEIEDLEARLAILRDKETGINGKIDLIDSQVKEIVLDFSPRLENLRKEKEDMIEKESCVTSKLKNLTQIENELKEKEENEQSFEKRCRCNINKLTSKIASMKNIEVEIDEEKVDLESVVDFDLLRFSRDDEHKTLQKKVKKLTDDLNTENCKVLEFSTQTARLKKVMNDIEARVGELEKEKTLAVSGRNFKVAKKITDQRNTLISDGQQSQCRLKELENESEQTETSIKRITNELSLCQEDLEKREMELDKKISTSLTNAISKLKNFKKRNNSSLWIMPFISFEISTCLDIVRDIHERYEWPLPEIITLEQEEEDEEEDGNACEKATETDVPREGINDRMIAAKLEELEVYLQQAVEDEDYDKADDLNTEIEKYKAMLVLQDE